MDEILMLQDEIGELQICFSEELCCEGGLDSDSDGGDPGDQLALQSTLTVLGVCSSLFSTCTLLWLLKI